MTKRAGPPARFIIEDFFENRFGASETA